MIIYVKYYTCHIIKQLLHTYSCNTWLYIIDWITNLPSTILLTLQNTYIIKNIKVEFQRMKGPILSILCITIYMSALWRILICCFYHTVFVIYLSVKSVNNQTHHYGHWRHNYYLHFISLDWFLCVNQHGIKE